MTVKSTFLSFLVGCALAAQSAPAKKQPMEGYRFGIQGGIVVPTSDSLKALSDKKTGIVFGGQVTRDLKTNYQRLRARLDYTLFPQATVRSQNGSGRTEDNKVRGLSAGLDYLHFTAGKPEGVFLAGGLTVANWTQDSSLDGNIGSTNLGLAGGAGWQINRDFSVEVRGTWSRWHTNFRAETIHNAATLNLEASYRF